MSESIVTLDRWADQYEANLPDGFTPDYESPIVPAHPDNSRRAAIVVNFSADHMFLIDRDVPPPNYTLVQGDQAQAVWWLAMPVSDDQSRGWNTYKHVVSALTYYLEGEVASGLFNLEAIAFGLDLARYKDWAGSPQFLADIKAWFQEHKKWTQKATFPREARLKGNQNMTDARKAANANARQKAREANRKRGLESARRVLLMVSEGLTDETIAATLGLSEGSVTTTIARARERMLPVDAELAKVQRPTFEPEVSMVEAQRLMSADDLAGLDWGHAADADLANLLRQEA